LLILSLFFANTHAQNYSLGPIIAGDWRLFEVPTSINFALLREYTYSHQKGILYLTDDEAVIPVWQEKDGYSLMRIDNNAKIKWRSKVPGFILGTAKWKDNVIAFYTRQWDYHNFLSGVHITEVSAVAFDMVTGKKTTEKVVYRNETKYAVQAIIHNRPNGEFAQLLIRQTKNVKSDRKDNWATGSLTAIALNENLTANSTELKTSESLKGHYIGSLVNNKGETFIITQLGKKLTAEKFDAKLVATGKLEEEFNLENEGAHVSLNENNDQSLLVALRNADKNKLQLVMLDFDFGANKAVKGNFIFNYAEETKLRAKNKEFGEKQANFDKDLFNLKMAGLVQTADKVIILFNEITANVNSSGTRFSNTYENGPSLVIFFDRKLAVVSSHAIGKKFDIPFQPPIRDWTLGAHVYGNQLVLVSNDGMKLKEQAAMIITIDLETMKVEKPYYAEREYTRVEGGATIWFKKNFILTRCVSEEHRVVGL
jgi:hypothetical protein